MIMKLSYRNELDIPVMLYNNQGNAQPVQPGQKLEMTFALMANEDDIVELILVAQPGS